MIRKIIYISVFALLLQTNLVLAGSTNEELKGSSSAQASECFEGVSRAVFKFNHGLDKAVFKPIAKGYRKLPVPIRKVTGNVVNNLRSLLTLSNNILQGEIKLAGQNTLRFVINTTIGILGIFDPASNIGLEEYIKEDYGQTLGSWGVGPGCYLVLPIFGPTTSRDLVGTVASLSGGDAWYNITVRNDTQYFTDFDYYFSRVGSGIDFRAKNLESFDNLEENSLDFYASVKSLYLQNRSQKISNDDVSDKSQDDSDWEEIDNQ